MLRPFVVLVYDARMAIENLDKGPTTEIGRHGGGSPKVGPLGRMGSWESYVNEAEHVPELLFPESIKTYERMLFTDAKVSGLYLGLTLPILNYTWWIEPAKDGGHTKETEALAADLGLPVGEPADDFEHPDEPGLFRFDFAQHLNEALLGTAYGFYFFEQVGVIGDDGLWHLKKLGARAPHTIGRFEVDEDGGLESIRQNITVIGSQGVAGLSMGQAPPIPVDRLVGYIWRPDARARWTGRSMLRPCHKHWILKDKLMRIDVINHDKAGGVPIVETDETYEGADLTGLAALASAFSVGEDSGGALPPGATLNLKSMGDTDVVGSMRYHDELMAFSWSEMVRQLGQTQSGSRALGATQADLEELARRAVAKWFVKTFREHVIEDWWSYNVPLDSSGRLPSHPTLGFRTTSTGSGAASMLEGPAAPVAAPAAPATDPAAEPVAGAAQVEAYARMRGCSERDGW